MKYNQKKQCYFRSNNIKYIDWKDVELLSKFVSAQGKIIDPKYTGTSAKYQRQVATAIKRARHMALLPFVNKK
ncbi:MAG: 30S ribosomal protein S18 [Candidatus Harrisonbacteria bacterium CG10_big_fil_rev_8_21_14_0_10_38_8]|uniref:Small ribosomal subunit protein bS18 n=1 Tax=Candidatus Harrisonbacteria bacterium CG10_big_fil_rev_8_21_14_0_10_38_8 TaxID=1974582 RepID=A0A2M6WJT4_9BACT|nr:MAG: 30S ribosomal protein S18 [Candidatus Harrisonbacteria bacterium CG10_big_fil_rev_8_21_14_0_10_38_8]